jgi:hypothetical protein
VHFGIPRSIISYRDTIFLNAFWTTLWEKMDTKLNMSTTFHPHIDGKTKVVNKTLVQLLRGYNHKYPKIWDENMMYIQHSYNRVVNTSTSKSSFEIFFGYFLSGCCIKDFNYLKTLNCQTRVSELRAATLYVLVRF